MVMVWHSVLILVVVEDGLAHADAWKQMQSRQVLILIIVDNGLVPTRQMTREATPEEMS